MGQSIGDLDVEGEDGLWPVWGGGVRVARVIYMIIFGGDLIASGIIKFP